MLKGNISHCYIDRLSVEYSGVFVDNKLYEHTLYVNWKKKKERMVHFIRCIPVSFGLVLNNKPLVVSKCHLCALYIFRFRGYSNLNEYRVTAFHFIIARIFQDIHPWLHGGIRMNYCCRSDSESPIVLLRDCVYPAGTHIQ